MDHYEEDIPVGHGSADERAGRSPRGVGADRAEPGDHASGFDAFSAGLAPPTGRFVSLAAALIAPEIAELITERRFRDLRDALSSLPPADTADVLQELSSEQLAVAFRLLPRDQAGHVFTEFDADQQEELIEHLGAERARQAIEALDPDDRARVLDELPTNVAMRLIASLRPQTRRETQAILGYPADSVGRIMTSAYVRLRPEWSIAQSIAHVREWGARAETIDWVYVVDAQHRLIDDLSIRELLLADPEATVSSIMDERFISLQCTDDREEAVRIFARYDRTALPVEDSRGTLLGIVTYDDVADVAEEEATEDIQKLGGMTALGQPYLKTRLFEMLRKRGPWLGILFLGQSMTVFILSGFEERLAQAVVLTLFIPLIIACGGNSGTQTASLMIRALALREVEPSDWFQIFRKELVTGLMLGIGLAALGIICLSLWSFFGILDTPHLYRLAFAVTMAILAVVSWGTILGSTLPLLLERAGMDPATSSSPMIATLMDASGMLIYFAIAVLLLSGTLL